MELKINNKTKQFALDSLTVQALLDLEIPEIRLLFKKN
jgi:sulfur carrier protein